MAIIDGWTQLAATQCTAPKEGTFEEKAIDEIIACIISPHHRNFTRLCFPNAWDPTRPLKLENNDENRLNNYYGIPVTCECNYEIPMLKGLPKAKKYKSAEDKNVRKNKTKDNDKTKDTSKNKNKSSSSKTADSVESSDKNKSSSSKSADSAESGDKNKNSKTRKSHKNSKEEPTNNKIEDILRIK